MWKYKVTFESEERVSITKLKKINKFMKGIGLTPIIAKQI